jgi:hypothetical protein
MEQRKHELALFMPRFTLRREKTVAQHTPENAKINRIFAVDLWVLQNTLDEIGMIYEIAGNMQESK